MGYREKWLAHHGVKGMKWGVRRYQPYGHGGYTPEGKGGGARSSKTRYGSLTGSRKKKALRAAAAVAGAAALTAATVYAAKSGALKRSAKFIGSKASSGVSSLRTGAKSATSKVGSKVKGSRVYGTVSSKLQAAKQRVRNAKQAREFGKISNNPHRLTRYANHLDSGRLMDVRPNRSVASIDKQLKIGQAAAARRSALTPYTQAYQNRERVKKLGRVAKSLK